LPAHQKIEFRDAQAELRKSQSRRLGRSLFQYQRPWRHAGFRILQKACLLRSGKLFARHRPVGRRCALAL